MKIAIRYGSKGGHTKKVAQAIGEALGIQAHPATVPLEGYVDLLFLGSGIYAGQVDGSVKIMAEMLEKDWVGKVALFGTAASRTGTEAKLRPALKARGIKVADPSFHCQGQFLFIGRGHPNAVDLQQAAAFAVMHARG